MDLLFNLIKNFVLIPGPSAYSDTVPSILPMKFPDNLIPYFAGDAFIPILLGNSTTNAARESTSRIIAHLSWENPNVIETFMKTLFSHYAYAVSTDDFPAILLALEELVACKDSLRQVRIKELDKYLSYLFEKMISKSYFHCLLLVDLFIRVALRSDYLLSLIQQSQSSFTGIKDWIESNRYPARNCVSWIKCSNAEIPLKKDLPSEDKAKFKDFANARIEALKKIAAKPSSKAGPGPAAILFQSEEYSSMIDSNWAEERIGKKKFDIRLKGGVWCQGSNLIYFVDLLYRDSSPISRASDSVFV